MKSKKTLNFKKPLFIWIGVFLVISVLMLIMLSFVNSDTDDLDALGHITYMDPNTLDIPHSVYNNIDSVEEIELGEDINGNIDYASIKGLTEGKKYSKQLVNENSRNILFVGEDKVSGLFDTIGIFSVDSQNKSIKVIMIPRDLYVDYNPKVKRELELKGKVNMPAFYKINCAHNIGVYMKYEGKFGAQSINFLSDVIKEKFDITIDDYIRVNTQGFVEIVNHFGGVKVNVPYDMNYDDPYQDLSIHLNKGMQLLNGKQAEGFVRCRYTYGSKGELVNHGDYERKKNQIAFIKAFIEQHGTLAKIDKLPGMLKSLSKNVKHSLGIGDILTSYIGLAKDAIDGKYKIESVTITGKDKIINKTYFIEIGE
jgi:LCP family protein required for cell wall assembly